MAENREGALGALHDEVLERGTLFALLFHLLTTAFLLSVLAALWHGVTSGDAAALAYAAVFGGIAADAFHRSDIEALVLTTFTPLYTVVAMLLFESLPAFADVGGAAGVYLGLAAAAFLLGLVPAYLLRDVVGEIHTYLGVALYGSSVIAVLSALLPASRALQSAAQSPQILLGSAGAASAGSPAAVAIVGIGLFSLPFLLYARQRDDVHPRLLAFYVAPALLYMLARAFLSAA